METAMKTITELALLPSESIEGTQGLVMVRLPDGRSLLAQTGTGPAAPAAQARVVTREEVQTLEVGQSLPLIVTGVASPAEGAAVLDRPDAAAVIGAWTSDPAQVRAFYLQLFCFELAHVGINLPSDSEALPLADTFTEMFGMEQAANPNSVFCGGVLEVMRSIGPGTQGHLAIRTNHLERAIAYFQRQGCVLDTEHPMHRPDGLMMGVYFQQDFGGFALHLMRRL